MKQLRITLLAAFLPLVLWAQDEPKNGAASPKRLLWEFKTGGGVWSSPAIGSDGTVYVGSDDGKLYAVNG